MEVCVRVILWIEVHHDTGGGAINKIDHAPVVPFAKGAGSVQARDKEPARRMDGKKSVGGVAREEERRVSRGRAGNKRTTYVFEACYTGKNPLEERERERGSSENISTNAWTRGRSRPPSRDDTGVKLTRLPAIFTKVWSTVVDASQRPGKLPG